MATRPLYVFDMAVKRVSTIPIDVTPPYVPPPELIALGSGGVRGTYSNDGATTWTSYTTAPEWNAPRDAVFSNQVIVVATTTGLYTSVDGLTWTLRQSGSYTRVIWDGTKFIALSLNVLVDGFWTSSNGTSWTQVIPSGLAGTIQHLAYFKGLYITGDSFNSSNIYSSPDLVTWTVRGSRAAWTSGVVVAGPDVCVVAPQSSSTAFARSSDGLTWSFGTLSTSAGRFTRGVYANGRYVICNDNPALPRVIHGTTGTSFTSFTPASGVYSSIIWDAPRSRYLLSNIGADLIALNSTVTSSSLVPVTDVDIQALVYIPQA